MRVYSLTSILRHQVSRELGASLDRRVSVQRRSLRLAMRPSLVKIKSPDTSLDDRSEPLSIYTRIAIDDLPERLPIPSTILTETRSTRSIRSTAESMIGVSIL